jgi:uncharacterized protein
VQNTIDVKVITKASRNCVKEEEGRVKVYVTAAPEKGKANKAVIELLAKYYGVSKSLITIIQGQTSTHKKIAVTQ